MIQNKTALGKRLLLGNEAIAQGAVEAGVSLVSSYPGTPISEIGDLFEKVAPKHGVYFEYSINEKVALEVAIGASVSGVRSLVAMKHVGLNVAADPFMTLAYTGVEGGLVLVSGDDPGCFSSQNEQDNRLYAALAQVPMLEPSDAAECKDMTKEAFELSERYRLPVLLRTTTRVNHSRGTVVLGDIREPRRSGAFKKDPSRFVPVPANARIRHKELLRINQELQKFASACDWNVTQGAGDLGIITSGISYLHALEALDMLGLRDAVTILKLGMTYPFPTDKVSEFIQQVGSILVLEELEPFLEDRIRACASRMNSSVSVYGKGFCGLSRAGEYTIEGVAEALAGLKPDARIRPTHQISAHIPMPQRPPVLCPGCSHRTTYFVIKAVFGSSPIFSTDIGCYTLGVQNPINMADLFTSMGASISSASGLSLFNSERVIAFIGDSTFYHSGITGLLNAVYNRHRFLLVILDNGITAMTGLQHHPGVDHKNKKAISMEELVRACGVDWVRTVDPHQVPETFRVFEEAKERKDLCVVISRHPCALMSGRQQTTRTSYEIKPSLCKACFNCSDPADCSVSSSKNYQLARARQAIRQGTDSRDVPSRGGHAAPCTASCPVGLCAQGYVTLIAAGERAAALQAIRDRIPLPAALGAVCHAPCEQSCARTNQGRTVQLRRLKAYAAEPLSSFHYDVAFQERLARIIWRPERIAVVGSGPAGLACAYDLLFMGYRPTVFDKAPVAGGVLALGIPEERLPKEKLQQEILFLRDAGIEFQLNTEIGKEVTFERLRNDYAAVFIAVGAWRPRRLSFASSSQPNVHQGIDFLRRVIMDGPCDMSGSVAVIGGGNCAIDAARTAARLGGTVTVYYRRGEAEMRALPEEIKAARKQGINFHFFVSPVGLHHDTGTGVLSFAPTGSSSPSMADVRRTGDRLVVRADHIIIAIGQEPELEPFGLLTAGIEHRHIPTNATTGATSLEGVFAGGDAAGGPATVVDAMAAGKKAAKAIDAFLNSRRTIQQSAADDAMNAVYASSVEQEEFQQALYAVGAGTSSAQQKTLLIESGSLDHTFAQEAALCAGCAPCQKCDLCVTQLGCPAFYVQAGVVAIREEICNGCGVCAVICPSGAIQQKERL